MPELIPCKCPVQPGGYLIHVSGCPNNKAWVRSNWSRLYLGEDQTKPATPAPKALFPIGHTHMFWRGNSITNQHCRCGLIWEKALCSINWPGPNSARCINSLFCPAGNAHGKRCACGTILWAHKYNLNITPPLADWPPIPDAPAP